MKRLMIALLIAGAVFTGCSKDKNQQAAAQQAEQQEQQSQASAPADQSGSTGMPQAQPPATQPQAQAPAPKPRPEPRPKPAVQEPARPAEPQMVTRLVPVPSGTELTAAMDQEVSTKADKAGSEFRATMHEPLTRNGVVLLPAGTKVMGTVASAKRAPRVGGKAEMTLEFKEITTPDGNKYRLIAQPLELVGKSSTEGDVAKTVGGAVGGAIVGGILGGKKGAGRGAAAGGAAGAAWAVATRGADIVLDPGSAVKVTVAREFEVPVQMRSDQPLP